MRGRATLQSRRTAALYTSAACSLVGIYLCLSASERPGHLDVHRLSNVKTALNLD
jgi:hypothetical protein